MIRRSILPALLLWLASAATTTAEEYPPGVPEERLVEPELRTVVGPIVGNVTDSSAVIWFQAPADHHVGLLHWIDQDRGPDAYQMVLDAGAGIKVLGPQASNRQSAEHQAVKVGLSDLQPDTSYRYAAFVGTSERDLRTNPLWIGRFRTAPARGSTAAFRVAVTSCLRAEFPHKSSWYLLAAQHPALLLLLGDNVYVDSTNPDRIWRRNIRQRSVPEFAAVARSTPVYAMWDDHDYGANDADRTLRGKKAALKAFRQLWPNPSAGTDDTPGAFYNFSWGDVDFFVLDGRYHRSPNSDPETPEKTMLGKGQERWLERELIASDATFKVLASGSTLRTSDKDGWKIFPHARRRLYRLVADNNISGVVYLSGDVHRSMIVRHPKRETGFYDLFEVVSSGITSSRDRSFATLEFDTTIADPAMRVRIHRGDGTISEDRTILLSQLTMREQN